MLSAGDDDMTVRELIEALAKIENQEAEVRSCSYDTHGDIDEVEYHPDLCGEAVVLLLDNESTQDGSGSDDYFRRLPVALFRWMQVTIRLHDVWMPQAVSEGRALKVCWSREHSRATQANCR